MDESTGQKKQRTAKSALSGDQHVQPSLLDEMDEAADETTSVTAKPPVTKRNVISGDEYATTAVVTRRSVSTYILAQDDERYNTSTGVAVRHMEGQIVAEVELRASQPVPDHTAIRQVASKLGGLDEDVLDICIANALNNEPNIDGTYSLDVDAIISARDRGVKRKRDGAAIYSSGTQAWARESIVESVKALDQLYISYGSATRTVRGKTVRDYNRVFLVMQKTLEEETGRLISFSYKFGTWWENYHDGLIAAPHALLALDARNAESLKALGRYFTLLIPEQNADGLIVRQVRDVIMTVRRSLEIGKNPQRLRIWLEEKLERLVHEGVITEWTYGPQERFDALPSYKWLDSWLELNVMVRPFKIGSPCIEAV